MAKDIREAGWAEAEPDTKRRLEPRYAPGYIHIPHLKAKMEWLCSCHPRVKRQYDVAAEVGISPPTLTLWITGTSYDDGRTIAPLNTECIPIKHYPSFLDIWGLPAAIIELDDLVEFKNALLTFEAGLGPWIKLIQALPDNAAIEMIEATATRGLIDPDEYEDSRLLQFSAGSEIIILVPRPEDEFKHGALLLQDRMSWACLRPNHRWRDTEIGDAMIFPRQEPGKERRFAQIEPIGGLSRVLAIFTRNPLPASVMEILLSKSLDVSSLNTTVPVLNALMAAGSCRLLARRFLVTTRGE